jgi:hypothetical protein
MNPDEIVMHEVDRQRCDVILDFFRVSIGQTRVAAHLHTHREILALDKAGADVLRVGIANTRRALAAYALRMAGEGPKSRWANFKLTHYRNFKLTHYPVS